MIELRTILMLKDTVTWRSSVSGMIIHTRLHMRLDGAARRQMWAAVSARRFPVAPNPRVYLAPSSTSRDMAISMTAETPAPPSYQTQIDREGVVPLGKPGALPRGEGILVLEHRDASPCPIGGLCWTAWGASTSLPVGQAVCLYGGSIEVTSDAEDSQGCSL